jgi:hypothetical protein
MDIQTEAYTFFIHFKYFGKMTHAISSKETIDKNETTYFLMSLILEMHAHSDISNELEK